MEVSTYGGLRDENDSDDASGFCTAPARRGGRAAAAQTDERIVVPLTDAAGR